ncbi:MAG TPA: hypothetical protein VEG66_05605 [Thermoplasmata archaeon]|jgi:hypothetical protein|nr:hypothetical protein [Thermoplasmata archaeon]
MVAFFGPSQQDLERLRSTVQSLGTTSVPGLAAALSMRERKAEKLLAHELARADTPILYEPSRRLVRWAIPAPPAPVPSPAPVAPPTPEPMRAPKAPAPVFTPVGLKTICPHCHVPLQSTGTESLAVCPQCGRLSSAREARNAERTSAPAVPPTPKGSAELSLEDRRSQELFAAYVSAKPIPCPKCRTPLRHHGLSEYVCPACGQAVRFPKLGEGRAPPAPSPPT